MRLSLDGPRSLATSSWISLTALQNLDITLKPNETHLKATIYSGGPHYLSLQPFLRS